MAACFLPVIFPLKYWRCLKESPVLSITRGLLKKKTIHFLCKLNSAEVSSEAGRPVVSTKLYEGVEYVLVQIGELFS